MERLALTFPAFANEPIEVQAAVSTMVWAGTSSRREHATHEGYFSFHHTELDAAFCGKFKKVNARLHFLDVKGTWRYASSTISEGFTKGYRLTEAYQSCLSQFLADRANKTTRILDGNGGGFATIPPTVGSLDMAGAGTKRWGILNVNSSLSVVKVNTKALLELVAVLDQVIDGFVLIEHPSQEPTILDPNFIEALDLKNRAQKLLVMSDTDILGKGNVMQRYVESQSGRLYGLGGASLQNASKILRYAALQGLQDYDINNCHFSVMVQMANKYGIECPHIADYISRKETIRSEIAEEVQISIEDTKKCMIALMYGAKTTGWHENAIPQLIGRHAAFILYQVPIFSNIVREVKSAGKAILDGTNANRQGGIENAFGKKIQTNKNTKKSRVLAHLLQGVEATALRACVEVASDSVVLLQHDGFTSTKRLHIPTLERAMKEATGFDLRLDEETLMPDLLAFKKRIEKSSFQKCN